MAFIIGAMCGACAALIIMSLCITAHMESEQENNYAHWVCDGYTRGGERTYHCTACQNQTEEKTAFCHHCGKRMVQP